MLLRDRSKQKFSIYMTDLILNFIRLGNENGMMEKIQKLAENEASGEYQMLREVLRDGFMKSIDNNEMLSIFKELELLSKKPN